MPKLVTQSVIGIKPGGIIQNLLEATDKIFIILFTQFEHTWYGDMVLLTVVDCICFDYLYVLVQGSV